jgi:hypothetical protein
VRNGSKGSHGKEVSAYDDASEERDGDFHCQHLLEAQDMGAHLVLREACIYDPGGCWQSLEP